MYPLKKASEGATLFRETGPEPVSARPREKSLFAARKSVPGKDNSQSRRALLSVIVVKKGVFHDVPKGKNSSPLLTVKKDGRGRIVQERRRRCSQREDLFPGEKRERIRARIEKGRNRIRHLTRHSPPGGPTRLESDVDRKSRIIVQAREALRADVKKEK